MQERLNLIAIGLKLRVSDLRPLTPVVCRRAGAAFGAAYSGHRLAEGVMNSPCCG